MLTPKSWLNDYIENEIDVKEFEEKMVMAGNAIENIVERGDDIQNVVIGKIVSIEQHPNADKLKICNVDIGSEEVVIVTGADNVFEGAIIPVALDKSTLPGGVKINASKLRGVTSFGMLCSGRELHIDNSVYPAAEVDGIMIMQDDSPIGEDVADFLGIRDTVFEFEVGANRPDLLSILGIAKETACTLETKYLPPETNFNENKENINDYISITVEDKDLCPRYMARAIKNVKIGPSPDWMRKRLANAGIRSINNIVDITNFVMLEYGQPMHAFDLNDIEDKKIIVRRAKDNETITTLDEKKHILSNSMLMICDGKKPIGIAGIMGGENSEIKENTTTVIFEAAKFAYGSVRQTCRSLGIATESGMRFSKGVDSANTEHALNRALNLVEQLGAGEIVGGQIDILSEDITPKTVTASAEKINEILGTQIPVNTMCEILNRLHLPTQAENGMLKTTVCGLRSDIAGVQDIAEEVARIYGYDNIPQRVMTGNIVRGRISEMEKLRDTIRTVMTRSGFFECITYSFGSENAIDKLMLKDEDMKNMIRIKNPLGEDKSVMRTQPYADILSSVAMNTSHHKEDVRLFELGRTYIPTGSELPDEQEYLCCAAAGKGEDFYSLKAVVENLLWILNVQNVKFEAGGMDCFHPGRKALVFARETLLGEIGEIHPVVAKNFDLEKERVICLWIKLKDLLSVINAERKYTSLPKFPAITRDLAFVVELELPAGEIFDTIKRSGGKLLESVEIFDVYIGENLGEDKKSIAFSLTFRAKDRTLAETDIAKSVEKIITFAKEKHSAVLRS